MNKLNFPRVAGFLLAALSLTACSAVKSPQAPSKPLPVPTAEAELVRCEKAAAELVGELVTPMLSQALRDRNLSMRVVAKDGRPYLVTRDYRQDRINIEVDKDRVVRASCG